MNFHELDTIMTRIGQESKIIYSGDFFQSDLLKNTDREGFGKFLSIINDMNEFKSIEFNIGDIVRSGLVRSYLIAKTKQGMNT